MFTGIRNRPAVVSGLLVLSASGGVRAHDAAQVGLRVDDAGRLVTRAYFGGTAFGGDDRVFGGTLDLVAGVPTGDEPAIAAPAGTFTAAGHLRIAFTQPLQIWVGSFFAPYAGRVQAAASSGSSAWTPTVPLDAALAPGIDLPVTGDSDLHEHPTYTLAGAFGRQAPTGIYLAEAVALGPDLDLLASEPFWIVFNFGRPHAEHDAVKDWARENLVPAPACAAPISLGLLAAGRRRRRATSG